MLCIMHEKDLKAFLVFIPEEDSLKISFLLDWFNAVFTDRVSMFGVFEWGFLPPRPPFFFFKEEIREFVNKKRFNKPVLSLYLNSKEVTACLMLRPS